jgi:hypothetical protein
MKRESLYTFSMDVIVFRIFSIQGWLYPWMKTPHIDKDPTHTDPTWLCTSSSVTLELEWAPESHGELGKTQVAGPHPWVSDSVDLEWGLSISCPFIYLFFQTGTHNKAQAGLKLVILLPSLLSAEITSTCLRAWPSVSFLTSSRWRWWYQPRAHT